MGRTSNTEDGKARVLTKIEVVGIFRNLTTQRNKRVFALGIFAGLRIGELLQLKVRDVYDQDMLTRDVIFIRPEYSKYCRGREVRVMKEGRRLLNSNRPSVSLRGDYLTHSKVYRGKVGTPLHLRTAHKFLSKSYSECGILGASTHSMRRTHAHLLDEAGVDLRAISAQLGHESLKDTLIYLKKMTGPELQVLTSTIPNIETNLFA